MAAKKERGSLKDPFTSENKPYFFDVGIADEMAVCYSCHAGGGVAEGIVKEDGTVTPYDDPTLSPVHTYDRDFYDYPATTNTQILLSQKSIADTMKSIGDGNGNPVKHNWQKSGVMENDCLICHTNPDSENTLVAADGLKSQPFRPRMMIFAERDSFGKVTKISLGSPTQTGLKAESVYNYSDSAQRMSRPTKKLLLMQLPKNIIGEMMDMWTKGLEQIENSGITLPYALYGLNVPKIWDNYGTNNQSIKSDYCANPNGPSDEMKKLQEANNAINNLFAGFLDYLKENKILPDNATENDMLETFFNDFIYAYKIKDSNGNLLPLPVPLRAYEPGKFYTDWDMPQASTRDYLRAPFIEGEGIPYTGMNGLAWGATLYGAELMMKGDMSYYDNNTGSIDTAKVLSDYMAGKILPNKIQPALHESLPYMFGYMATARLMGIDINHDGAPLTYIQIVKSGSEWIPKAYYNKSDLGDGKVHFDIFGGDKDVNSWKWVKICGQCHEQYKDDGNSNWEVVRPFGLGMGADVVKNGRYVNFTNDTEASGYEVHQSNKKMGCGSCHFRETGSLEAKHNFLKGTDTAHMVRNDLDNNPKPKSCEYCHLNGGDSNAPNPTKAHEEKFGETAEKHIAEIACQTCHIPYRRTWRFRAFNDTFGYYLNFDNRFGYNVLPGGNGKAMAFPGEYAVSPVYGTSPGYGLSQLNALTNHIDADGKGIVPMDLVTEMSLYFQNGSEADPGKIVNGMPTNPKFDFYHYFYKMGLDQMKINYNPQHDMESEPPLYWANGTNGYPQIVIGEPITVMTWVDLNPQPDKDLSDLPYNGAKILYIKELNGAVKAFLPRVAIDPSLTPEELAKIPPNDADWAKNPNVAKIILRDSGYVMFDHTGDGFPDLWWPEDVKAMREALIKVLTAEGEVNPDPRVFIAAHFFSDSHGVQPAEKALGAKSCNDCHGDYKKDSGSHRITDKEIVFIPWNAPFMAEKYKYSDNNKEGLFIFDNDVNFLKSSEANGLKFIGAKASDLLTATKHQAEELFYIAAEGTVTGTELENLFDISLTAEEKAKTYVKQIVNGPWSDKNYFYVPEELKKEITEMGFEPQKEYVYLEGKGFAQSYIARIGFENANHEAMIIKLPFQGTEAEIYKKDEGSYGYKLDRKAEVIEYLGSYVVVKVEGGGEYVAVEKGTQAIGPGPEFQKLWGAFMK